MDELQTYKTPAQLAEDARRASHDATLAAWNVAAEARTTGQHAARVARDAASDAGDIASDAATTGRVYARNAAVAASEKFNEKFGQLRRRAHDLRTNSASYVANQPVRAVAWAMAGGAALMAVLVATRPRRY
ncbi:hypothetical protein WKW79_00115 [Variovorax robiniae]|uniref:DUF883 domain-containing protein n=1 Tax=Variovorax robiniae TaxID=1836199 RepID=A0ABU8WZH8_9BURK